MEHLEGCKLLTSKEEESIKGGAIPLLGTVVAVGAIGVLLITIYKLYQSSKGEVHLGTGISFKWDIG